MIGLSYGFADIKKIESTSLPKMSVAVIAMLDNGTDCSSHPELAPNCLQSLAFNATDQPDGNSDAHFPSAAGTGMAATDNSMGVFSPGGFMGRIKFFPVKVCEGRECRPEWVQAGLAYVLQKVIDGVPIVVIGCNVASGVTDPAGMDNILKGLDAAHVYLIAPSPDGTPPINMDDFEGFPSSYSRQYKNIVSVTAGDTSGERLAPGSYWGANTFSLSVPGINIKTISSLDPNGSASMSGSSSITQQIAAIYALVRVYVEADADKAMERMKFTARMYPELEGKLKTAPGNSDDAGRMAGKVDVHDALTMPFGCPAPSSAIMVVTKRDTNRAVALSSPLMVPGPFALQDAFNPDGTTRIVLFAYNVGNSPAAIIVQAKNADGKLVRLPVEAVNSLSGDVSCVTQLNVALTSQPQLSSGDRPMTITVGTQTSAEFIITLK